ncbi:D-lactate dehydrogenase [Eionea flava]
MNNCSLINALSRIVGKKNIAQTEAATEHYRTGFRSGSGNALAVVFPQTLIQQWQIIQCCVDANTIMIMQAANTGLTEGSTPSGNDYDRDIIIINTTRLSGLILLNNAEQVISLPGATLHQLEETLRPYGRAPHSVIGSSCIGASITGGIANNSGGALVKRGPAYTELSLYAQVTAKGELKLVNELGIDLGNTPIEILTNLENNNFPTHDAPMPNQLASDKEYDQRIRDINAPTPARYNADKRRLYGASGCAGKVAIFAVRLDTFAIPKREKIFYIGTNNPDDLTKLRHDILQKFTHLPDVAEYMHRDTFDIAETYGKDTTIMIDKLGTKHLPKLFAYKGKITALLDRLPLIPKNLPDKCLQSLSRCFKNPLPKRLLNFRDRFEHHLILKVSDSAIEETLNYFYYASSFANDNTENNYIICNQNEANKALLHRFAAAGAAVRYQTVHDKHVEDILALDIALPRNEKNWREVLPESIKKQLIHTLYYGHFLCHVFHQDYIVKKGVDVRALKKKILQELDSRGAKYPAEHNVGHLYEAENDLKAFYKKLDPTNSFNPGIGHTSKRRNCC